MVVSLSTSSSQNVIAQIHFEQENIRKNADEIKQGLQSLYEMIRSIRTRKDYEEAKERLIDLEKSIQEFPKEPFAKNLYIQLSPILGAMKTALRANDPDAWKTDWAARSVICSGIAAYFAIYVHSQQHTAAPFFSGLRELDPWSYGISMALLGTGAALVIEKIVPQILLKSAQTFIGFIQKSA